MPLLQKRMSSIDGNRFCIACMGNVPLNFVIIALQWLGVREESQCSKLPVQQKRKPV